jgi:hypothetical protein
MSPFRALVPGDCGCLPGRCPSLCCCLLLCRCLLLCWRVLTCRGRPPGRCPLLRGRFLPGSGLVGGGFGLGRGPDRCPALPPSWQYLPGRRLPAWSPACHVSWPARLPWRWAVSRPRPGTRMRILYLTRVWACPARLPTRRLAASQNSLLTLGPAGYVAALDHAAQDTRPAQQPVLANAAVAARLASIAGRTRDTRDGRPDERARPAAAWVAPTPAPQIQ